MSTRRRLLGDISTFQLAAGALAAMTSAWIASTLGVAGTIIGAAVGSLVLTTTSAFYSRTLETGRTLIVQTSDGSSVETHAEEGETMEALAAVEEATGSPVQGAEVVDDVDPDASRDWRTLPWKRIAVSTVAALVIAFGAMSAYEAVTGNAYGSDPDATRISNPFSGGGGSSSQQQTPDDDSEGGDPAPTDPDAPQDDDAEDGGDQNVPPTPVAPTTPAPAPTTPAPTAPAPTAPPADQ